MSSIIDLISFRGSDWFHLQSPQPVSRGVPGPVSFCSSTGSKLNQVRGVTTFSELASKSVGKMEKKWAVCVEHINKMLSAYDGEHLSDVLKCDLELMFEKISPKNVEIFFEEALDKAIENKDMHLSDLALEAVSVEKMLLAVKEKHPIEFKSLEDLIDELAKVLPPETKSYTPAFKPELFDRGNVITNFFPNMGRIFMRAFDLFDSVRPPDTLYEYGVLITLYFNFFKLPYYLVEVIGKFLPNPLQVLVVTALVLGIAIGVLYVHLRWCRVCPEKVDYCNILALKNEQPFASMCRVDELNLAEGCINSGRSVVFVGDPGVGKTHIMQELAARLKDKKVFVFDHSALFGQSSSIMSTAEKMNMSFKQVKGFEGRVAFICDELGDALQSKFHDIVAIFKLLKDEYPNIVIFTAMTSVQWEELRKRDPALEDRFKAIFIKETNESETLRILQEASSSEQGVSISLSGLQKEVEVTNGIDGHAQPRKAINPLKELIKRIEYNRLYPERITTERMKKAHIALQNLRGQSNMRDSATRRFGSEEYRKFQEEVNKAQEEFEFAEKEMKEQQLVAKNVMNLLEADRYYQQQRNSAVRVLSVRKSLSPDDVELWKKRLLFSNFFVFHHFDKKIDELSKKLQKDIYLQVDARTVAQAAKR